MSSVIIAGNTSGTITLDAPNVAGTTTLTLPTTSGTVLTSASSVAASQLPSGSILQVVSASKSDTFSTTARSFADITGLSLSITPKFSTSKILVFMAIQVSNDGADTTMVQMVRNSTAIGIGDARGVRIRNTTQSAFGSNSVSSLTGITLDSPSTTSATTYKLQTRADSGTAFVNTQSGTADGTYHGTQYSTIMVMEIAA
jgi:hypothetical protein